MAVSKKVLSYLDGKKISYEIVPHKKVFTAYDLAQTLGEELNKIAKTLLVKVELPQLKKKVSDYVRENIWLTTSGMPWPPTIRYCQEVMGMDRVLYAMDYPYQFVAAEVTMQDGLAISDADKKKFFQTNAEMLFKIR